MTVPARGLRSIALAALAATVLAACSATTDVPAAVDDDVVEVFSVHRGRDAEALGAVLSLFTEQTGIRTRHMGTAGFAEQLQDRVRDGDPPDVALIPQPAVLEQLARDGHLVALDDLPEVETTLLPGAADVGMLHGRRYGVWFKLSVKSLVWFPPETFGAAVQSPPATWSELLALTRRLDRQGQTPWCLGMESFAATGWVGTDWIEDLVLRLHGPEVYDQWSAGAIPFTDPRIRQAFEAFAELALTSGHVLGGRRGILTTPALAAIEPMLEDPPGCLMTRQASFQEAELPEDLSIAPGGDLDVVVFPPVEPGPAPLVAAGQIAAAFNERSEVAALMRFLADPAAGEPWAEVGGFTSPHATFDAAAYSRPFDRRVADLVAKADVVRFDASDQMLPEVGTGTFWQGITDYVAGVPLDRVLQGIQAGYGMDRTAS